MVKTYKATVIAKERELTARETAFSEKESRMHAVLSKRMSRSRFCDNTSLIRSPPSTLVSRRLSPNERKSLEGQ